ncbi:MAG: hydrophobe/amphiphile efflux-1 family RND transporter [Planctomycetota bacterium]|nr:MAG: hydrophobe/amphiphile efflux-1 family RND transporter [Planctomycetota bacterium]
MLSRFFIERPIFATVLAIMMVLAGSVSVFTLPVAQYPNIAPPTVEVTTVYPGANARVVAETVAAPIEQEVNGVENMLYMSSTCTNDGNYTLTITFDVGTNLDIASVLVQNRVAIAMATLPDDVTRQGVVTEKKSSEIVQFIALTSQDGTYDEVFLANYLTLRVTDEISRIVGVGDAVAFGGADYSMRVWLDPFKLKSRSLTTEDVLDAIREQNVQVAAGQIGAPPAPDTQAFQLTINTLGRLEDVSQFEDIIVKTGESGRVTRLSDVARLELGGENYDMFAQVKGRVSAALAIYLLPGANSLDMADNVRATMERLALDFPEGMEYDIPFDTTLFVRSSIDEVFTTLWQAALLVFLVIFVFLGDWRASLVPAATIPVSLIATFAVMAGLGFSINLTTLFGLVLVIGIVVDDAIVVVENTSRLIENGMAPRAAAIQAMEEVTGPVIATTLVLLAVFIPTAFLPGITGELYRQFGLTISAATVFSSINALTLSPALCALLLRKAPDQKNIFFRTFDACFAWVERGYGAIVAAMIRKSFFSMLIFGGVVFFAISGFARLPTGFLPEEDQGYVISGFQLPDAASQGRTRELISQVNNILKRAPGVESWFTLGGFSILDNAQASNAAATWIMLKPFEERDVAAPEVLTWIRQQFAGIEDGNSFAFNPPTISGLGSVGGFQMELQDKGGVGFGTLQQVAQEMAADGNTQSELQGLNSTFRASVPQLFVDIDRTQAKSMGVPLNSVFSTLQAYLGSAYVNDFNKFGRTYQVKVQADHAFRQEPESIRRLDVRNEQGDMVPMGAIASVRGDFGPQIVRRYNLYPAASINGNPAAGVSSGEAMTLMENMGDEKLPASMGYDWTGLSYQEKQVGSESIMIFGLALIMVFLVLAAQYESWTAPISIVLSVPCALIGVVLAVGSRGMSNDVYTQIGIVLLIGLASKASILIVEFARELRGEGKTIIEAATEAAKLRFRPLLMTTISFVFGTLPLLVASGAGAGSRQAVGTAVFGGMLSATFLAVIFVPVFFRVFQGFGEKVFGEKVIGARAPEDVGEPASSAS